MLQAVKVWKTKDLKPETKAQNTALKFFNIHEYTSYPQSEVADIAIVGGGPKGLYALDNLRQALQESDFNMPLEIHWYNKNHFFGSGDIYRTDQPEFLLINFCIGNINMWHRDDLHGFEKLSLTEWIRANVMDSSRVSEDDFASRALVGHYLQDGLNQLVKQLPHYVKLRCVKGEVVDLVPNERGKCFSLITLSEDHLPVKYNEIMLATGHSNNFTNKGLEALLYSYTERSKFNFIQGIYPVDQKLNTIPAHGHVCIKGLGLTFIDAVLALTEGRGGQFVTKDNQCIYHPSGKEPKTISCFSRSGLPMLPRSSSWQDSPYPLKWINTELVSDLLVDKGNISFEEDLWHLLQKEFAHAYHQAGLERSKFNKQIDSDSKINTPTTIDTGEEASFNIDDFFNFTASDKILSAEEYHGKMMQFLKTGVAEAKMDQRFSQWMAIAAVWKQALPLVAKCYEFGGFTASSQQCFEANYLGKLNQISFGPPVVNAEKLLAIAESGILKFHLGRNTHLKFYSDEIHIYSEQTQASFKIDALIDARIPKNDFDTGVSLLYKNLLHRKLAKPFQNKAHKPGCVSINTGGQLLGHDGRIISNIALMGTPTEGITLDNDSLSRKRNDFSRLWGKRVVAALIEKQTKKPANDIELCDAK